MTRQRVVVLALGALSACASPSGGTAVGPAAPASGPPAKAEADTPPHRTEDGAARLDDVERTLATEPVRLRFDVTSAGVLESRMVGLLEMEGNRVRLEARGTFAGQAVELSFDADGTRMRGRGGARAFELSQPTTLREAIAVGIVRMGILHTLAMLASGAPPDHADGGVDAWLSLAVLTGAPTVAEMDPVHDSLPTDPVTFDVQVGGDPAVHATLWVADGLPLERQQQTRFPEGEMVVRESFDPG